MKADQALFKVFPTVDAPLVDVDASLLSRVDDLYGSQYFGTGDLPLSPSDLLLT